MISGSEVIDPCPISVAGRHDGDVAIGRDADPRAHFFAGPLRRDDGSVCASTQCNGK